jgi:hypothetical protein
MTEIQFLLKAGNTCMKSDRNGNPDPGFLYHLVDIFCHAEIICLFISASTGHNRKRTLPVVAVDRGDHRPTKVGRTPSRLLPSLVRRYNKYK